MKIPRTKTFETVSLLKLPAGPADDQKVILFNIFTVIDIILTFII